METFNKYKGKEKERVEIICSMCECRYAPVPFLSLPIQLPFPFFSISPLPHNSPPPFFSSQFPNSHAIHKHYVNKYSGSEMLERERERERERDDSG